MTRSDGDLRVVGIDGGATHTRYLLSDRDGTVRGRRHGMGCLVGAGDDNGIADRIVAEVRALAGDGGDRLPLDAVCAGLAGAAGRPESTEALRARILTSGVARNVTVITDGEVAFVDAFGAGPGILLIAGTGSIALARGTATAPMIRVGGWGALVGDEGSGYRIGLDALRAAIRGSEGRGPSTVLSDAIMAAVGVDDVRGVFEWSLGVSKAPVAALAPRVVAAADCGDSVARQVVDDAVDALVAHARALVAALPGDHPKPSVALVGGLVEPGGILRVRALEALRADGLDPLEAPVDPARGAARMAVELVGPA